MADINPTLYVNSISFLAANSATPTEGIFIPLASLPGLTAAEVDPYNGDIRKLMYGINRAVFTSLNQMATANRPTKFNITRATPVGVNATTIRQSYTTSFDLAIDDVDVAPENVSVT